MKEQRPRLQLTSRYQMKFWQGLKNILQRDGEARLGRLSAAQLTLIGKLEAAGKIRTEDDGGTLVCRFPEDRGSKQAE